MITFAYLCLDVLVWLFRSSVIRLDDMLLWETTIPFLFFCFSLSALLVGCYCVVNVSANVYVSC